MLKTLRELFDGLRESRADDVREDAQALRLACAVLLVEVMRADPEITENERRAVLDALRRRFPGADEELAALVAEAEQASRSASDFHQFTSQLNLQLDQPAKIAVVETLWQVAYADGAIGAHENHVISRIAGLLHVTHGEYIAAKLHARQANAGGL